MPTSAPSYLFCTQADVEAFLSVDGVLGRLDDDASGANSATESGYLTTIIRWVTSRIHLHCTAYEASVLAESWVINQYAAIMAAYYASARRGNPPSGTLSQMYEEVMADLGKIKSGEFALPDAAKRDSAFPAWSNMSIDSRRAVHKMRVEPSLSSNKGDRSGRAVDRAAEIIGPIEKAW